MGEFAREGDGSLVKETHRSWNDDLHATLVLEVINVGGRSRAELDGWDDTWMTRIHAIA